MSMWWNMQGMTAGARDLNLKIKYNIVALYSK